MEARAIVLLLILAAAAGCLGSDGTSEEGNEASTIEPHQTPVRTNHTPGVPEGPPSQVWPASANVSWQTSSRTETERSGGHFRAPNATAGIWFSYDFRVDGPAGTLEVFARTPNGSRIDVHFAQSGAQPYRYDGTFSLPGIEGEWWIGAESDRPANGSFQIEMRPDPWPQQLPRVPGQGASRPVVAVVDTGINPYHETFQTGLGTEELPERIRETATGQPPVPVALEPGRDLETTYRSDVGFWKAFPSDTLVHFQGTNLLAFKEGNVTNEGVFDHGGHGTPVVHAVLKANPRALVIYVSAEGGFVDAVEWVSGQPWIDVVSISWGPLLEVPGYGTPSGSWEGHANATRAVWESGKLVFAATKNAPTPSTPNPAAAPWVHAVSGAHHEGRSRALKSGNLADTVANWTQRLALADSLNETAPVSGTSFATPRTAGVASAILGQVRQALDHEGNARPDAMATGPELVLSNSDLRAALNRTAVYWNTTDYEGPGEPGTSVPVAPTPWVSMGWGYLDARRVQPAVDHLLGEDELEEKPPEAKAFMQANLQARKAYWNR